MQNNNIFQISGFIAQDAQIRQFTTASVARFPLSVAHTEKLEGEDMALFERTWIKSSSSAGIVGRLIQESALNYSIFGYAQSRIIIYKKNCG